MKFFYALTGCCTFLILLLDSDASLTAQDKVGINTTSPKETVHVMGGLLVEGGLLVGTSDTLHTYVMNSEAESTDTSGVLYDTGGPTGNYGNNEASSFWIHPNAASSVRLSLDSMDTEAPYDYLVFQWGDGRLDTVSGSTTGVYEGPEEVYVVFFSNGVNTAEGFKISWNGIYPVLNDSSEVDGLGGRLHWIPGKYALRSGFVDAGQWDIMNIGNYSFATGFNSLASGNYSIAMGNSVVASGQHSTAMGYNTTASGLNSTATGFSSIASGDHSMAIGYQTDADAYGSVAIGTYNVGGGNPATWVEMDPIFELGIGTSDVNRANALTVLKNGKVGIGTATPDEQLEVVGGAKIDSITFVVHETNNKVGIGTAGPPGILTVSGTLDGVGSSSPHDMTLLVRNTNQTIGVGPAIGLGADGGAVGAKIAHVRTGTNSTGDLLLFTKSTDLSERLRITSEGKVGIGTESPAYLLHIYGEALFQADEAGLLLEQGSDNVTLRFRTPGGGVSFGSLVLKNGLSYFNGNLGIGTSAPNEKLDVAGGAEIDGSTFVVDETNDRVGIGTSTPPSLLSTDGVLNGFSGTTASDMSIFVRRASTVLGEGPAIGFCADNTYSLGAKIAFVRAGSNSAGSLRFFTKPGTSDPITEQMVISHDGNVGIGTSVPNEKLDVLGGAEIDGSTFVVDETNNRVGIGTSAPQERLHVEGTIEVDQMIRANDSGGLDFASDEGTIRLKIEDLGDVGIGTTNPNKKLHVLGEARFESNSGGAQIFLDGTSGLNEIEFQNSGAYAAGIGYSITNDRIYLYHGGNVFVKSGNLGVGVEPTHKIDVSGGAYCTGTTWTNASSRSLKENFQKVNSHSILDRLSEIPVSEWNYISEGPEIRHIGPMAEDFHAAFGLGGDDKTISTVDIAGVSMAAIQALHEENKALQQDNAEMKGLIQELMKRVEALERKP